MIVASLVLLALVAMTHTPLLYNMLFTAKAAKGVNVVGFYMTKLAAGFMIPTIYAAYSQISSPNKQMLLCLGMHMAPSLVSIL